MSQSLLSPRGGRPARTVATTLTVLAGCLAAATAAWLVVRPLTTPAGSGAPEVPPPHVERPISAAPADDDSNAKPPQVSTALYEKPAEPAPSLADPPPASDLPMRPAVWVRKAGPPTFHPDNGKAADDDRDAAGDGRLRRLELSPTGAVLNDSRTINGGVQWDWTFRFAWDEPPAVLVPGRPVRLAVTGTADGPGRKDAAGPADLQAGAASAYLRVAGGRATWRTVEGDGAERGFLDRACHAGAYRVGGWVKNYAAGRAVYQIDAAPDDGADGLTVEIRVEGTERGVVSYPYERKEVTEAEMHDLLGKPDEGRLP